jgi:hypothetical protein
MLHQERASLEPCLMADRLFQELEECELSNGFCQASVRRADRRLTHS